jgi:hypothetical protein
MERRCLMWYSTLISVNSRRKRVIPVITTFEGDEGMSLICINVSEHIKLSMKTFVVGLMGVLKKKNCFR